MISSIYGNQASNCCGLNQLIDMIIVMSCDGSEWILNFVPNILSQETPVPKIAGQFRRNCPWETLANFLSFHKSSFFRSHSRTKTNHVPFTATKTDKARNTDACMRHLRPLFTRGQFWPPGIVACVWLCVCLFVYHLHVRAISQDPFKLGLQNLDQRCITSWWRSLLFCGVIDLELQGQI